MASAPTPASGPEPQSASTTPPDAGAGAGAAGSVALATPELPSLANAVHRVVVDNFDSIRALATRIGIARRVRLVGVGECWHLAEAGEYLLRSIGMDARAANAFDLVTWPSQLERDDAILLLCQPGQNAYTARLASRCTHSGLPFLALSFGDVPQMQGADIHLDLSSTPGADIDPFVSAFAVLLTIAARYSPESPLARAAATPREQMRVVERNATAANLQWLASRATGGVTLVGAGPTLAAAHVLAQRLRSTFGITTTVLHLDALLSAPQPLAGIAPDGLLLFLAPDEAAHDRQRELSSLLTRERPCATWIISTDDLPPVPAAPNRPGIVQTRLADVPDVVTPLQYVALLHTWLPVITAVQQANTTQDAPPTQADATA